jgi:uncharacterized membrane protein
VDDCLLLVLSTFIPLIKYKPLTNVSATMMVDAMRSLEIEFFWPVRGLFFFGFTLLFLLTMVDSILGWGRCLFN